MTHAMADCMLSKVEKYSIQNCFLLILFNLCRSDIYQTAFTPNLQNLVSKDMISM